MFGLNGIDYKIRDVLLSLGVQDKFFIEAGANDGLSQSNTALLEFQYGWTGVLVEPSLENFERARSVRKNSRVYRGALVSNSYERETIPGIFSSDSLSRWGGLCSGVTEEHLKFDPEWICEVPALTLDRVLEDCKAPESIGLMSLDVEGYELEVLRGLNTEKWRPKVVVMEIGRFDIPEVYKAHLDYMSSIGYPLHSEVSEHDFVFYDSRVFGVLK